MTELARAAMAPFEDEMVAHSRVFAPELCEALGEQELRAALRRAMARAGNHGFSLRGPLRLAVEMMFLFGSDFDADPQYPWIARILEGDDDQMSKAEQLHEQTEGYLERVSGRNNANTRFFWEKLRSLPDKPLKWTVDSFDATVTGVVAELFPEKVAFVGEEGINELIRMARQAAREFGFATLGADALLVILMFAFGRGCADDPLYPWIGRTLRDERIVDQAARLERLERKALAWLEQVLSGKDNSQMP